MFVTKLVTLLFKVLVFALQEIQEALVMETGLSDVRGGE